MDSMRSLNSSLPSSRPTRSAPPEELLQAFRSAALSVTNLYKSAATSQQNARQAGYQDALEELLKFLDKENLGLQDGEGWRVREWATARYDGSTSVEEDTNEEQEQQEQGGTSRAVSQEGDDTVVQQRNSEETTNASKQELEEDSDSPERPSVFRFTANNQPDNDMQTDAPGSPQPIEESSSASSSTAPIRVEVLNRSRPTSRSHHSRHNTYANPRDFTFTAGTKRKMQFPDFFDISSLNEKRDGSGGGNGPKRGRFA